MSNLRRLSSRLNSASGGIIAVRLLHGVRESVSRIDDSPANRPQADPAVFGRGEGLGRGLMLGRGPVRRGGPGPDWVKLGQNGCRGGGPPEVSREMDIGGRTSYAGTMPMASISCRPHRTVKPLRRSGFG